MRSNSIPIPSFDQLLDAFKKLLNLLQKEENLLSDDECSEDLTLLEVLEEASEHNPNNIPDSIELLITFLLLDLALNKQNLKPIHDLSDEEIETSDDKISIKTINTACENIKKIWADLSSCGKKPESFARGLLLQDWAVASLFIENSDIPSIIWNHLYQNENNKSFIIFIKATSKHLKKCLNDYSNSNDSISEQQEYANAINRFNSIKQELFNKKNVEIIDLTQHNETKKRKANHTSHDTTQGKKAKHPKPWEEFCTVFKTKKKTPPNEESTQKRRSQPGLGNTSY